MGEEILMAIPARIITQTHASSVNPLCEGLNDVHLVVVVPQPPAWARLFCTYGGAYWKLTTAVLQECIRPLMETSLVICSVTPKVAYAYYEFPRLENRAQHARDYRKLIHPKIKTGVSISAEDALCYLFRVEDLGLFPYLVKQFCDGDQLRFVIAKGEGECADILQAFEDWFLHQENGANMMGESMLTAFFGYDGYPLYFESTHEDVFSQVVLSCQKVISK